MKYFFLIIISVCIFIGGNAVAQYDTCAHLKEWEVKGHGNTKESAQQQYDSLRLYIEKCAATDPTSYHAFTSIDGAVKLCSDDWTRYDHYRDWLISVLYLNTTDPYFCRCIGSMAGTYQYGKYNPTNAGIAVYRYLRSNSRCNNQAVQEEITKDSLDLIHTGKDTTIPSLESLGLGFLLNSSGVAPSASLGQTYLASFIANPNPFKEEVRLNFHLNRMSYCSVQIFDLLGRILFETKGRTFEQGDHEIAANAQAFPQGALYARISTGFGEVKTVKVIKE